MKAKIENGQLIKYPYTLSDLRRDNPNTMFPADFYDWDSFGCVDVVATEKPVADVVTESDPEFSNGEWRQTFTTRNYTAEEIANINMDKTNGIISERRRRLAAGFDYDFGDSRGTHIIGTYEKDMIGWDEVTKWAAAKLALGQTAATIDIMTETAPATVTPGEWYAIMDAASTFRQPIWAASFLLQMTLPDDYTNDQYWP